MLTFSFRFSQIAMSLPSLLDPKSLTHLGSQLFLRCVSGTRVVPNSQVQVIHGHTFRGWGAHHDSYPTPYLTAAATIGMTTADVEHFLHRLTKTLESWTAKQSIALPAVISSNGPECENGEAEAT